MAKLIVGLGNPGPSYRHTRHNIGFMVVERLAADHSLRFSRGRGPAELAIGTLESQTVILAKPQTYMNESGRAVAEISQFYHLPLVDLLIIHDDLDRPFGHLRLRGQGSSGGQRGLQSIIQHLHSDQIARLKIGIGRPAASQPAERYVLASFSTSEIDLLPLVIETAAAAATRWLIDGLRLAMTRYNNWSPLPPVDTTATDT